MKDINSFHNVNKYWLFEDSQDVAIITTKNIVFEKSDILYVSHDLDDGMWQFHSNKGINQDFLADAVVISLFEIVNLDPSLQNLASLPRGWIAWRASKNMPWSRSEKS